MRTCVNFSNSLETKLFSPRAALFALGITHLLCATVTGCTTREIVYVVQQPNGATHATATTTVMLNCEPICRQSYNSCRVGCRPQAWSPNMGAIENACEHDCDFNRFSCESECRQSNRSSAQANVVAR